MTTRLRSEANVWLRKILRRRKYLVVLNIGCGKDKDQEGGHYSNYIRSNKMFMVDKKPFPGIVQTSIEHLPFRNQMTDLVFGNWVIYKTDLSRSIPEICRVLKPDGEIILSSASPNLKRIKQVRNALYQKFKIINVFGPKI